MKSQVKFWRAANKNLWKLIIPISAKLNFLSSNEMPMKLKKLLQKTTYFNFCAIYFSDFSWFAWTENIRKTISEFFGNGVLVFSREISGSFLLIPPPPTVEAQNLPPPPPHAEANSSLIGSISLVRELKHYADYYFAYPLWCGGELRGWVPQT